MPLPLRTLSVLAKLARLALVLVAALWLALGMTWALLHFWIVPRIDELRPRLEQLATQQLGVVVRIESIQAQGGGLIPAFELRAVALQGAGAQQALLLPRVVVSVSPRSLWRLGFEQIYLERPDLLVQRTASGELRVAGMVLGSLDQPHDSSAVADWLFSQTEVVVRGGRVTWADERGPTGQGPVQPLVLEQVDLVLRNPGRRHLVRLDATPPPQWGERWSAMGVFRRPVLSAASPGDFNAWQGQAYGAFPLLDVAQLRRYADLGAQVSAGRGALRTWIDVAAGKVTHATTDLALTEVDVTLDPTLQPLALESVTGRIGLRSLTGGLEVTTDDLRFRTRDGLAWPGGKLLVSYQNTAPSAAAPASPSWVQGRLQADQIDLTALAQIASKLPLGTTTLAQIQALAPSGQVRNLQAQWQGEPWKLPVRYEVSGAASHLSLGWPLATSANTTPTAPAPGWALRGLDLSFEATQAGGWAQVQLRSGVLNLPGVFEEPHLPIDELSAQLRWQQQGRTVQLNVERLSFANADAAGQAQATWRTSDVAQGAAEAANRALPGILDLQGSLSRADGARVWRYLPLQIPASARHYVRDAVQQGQASAVKFRVKGDLRHMPFTDPRLGEFYISAQVRDTTFAYVPPQLVTANTQRWPALTDLSGELIFDRNSMQVRAAKARVQGGGQLQVLRAESRIPDLAHSTTVVVSADLRGPLGDALALVKDTALDGLTAQALTQATGKGTLALGLQLKLPLAALDKTQVNGTATLTDSTLRLSTDTPQLSQARAVVAFNQSGFAVSNAQARMLGGEVRFDGGTYKIPATAPGATPETAVRFRGQGQLSAQGLRLAPELAWAQALGAHAQGTANYSVTLGWRHGRPEISLSSTLQGLSLDLPAPLQKTAEQALPLRFEQSLLSESLGKGRALQDQMRLALGEMIRADYVRDVSAKSPRVLRGALAVNLLPGENAAMPDSGVSANIRLDHVNLDEWSRLLQAPGPTGSAQAVEIQLEPSYLPTRWALRASELTLASQRWHDVVLGGSRDQLLWRSAVDARELGGYIEYRQPNTVSAASGTGRLYARLARLSLNPQQSAQVEAALAQQPASIPALDVVVDQFDLNGKALGHLEIEAINRLVDSGLRHAAVRDGAPREWRLTKLNLSVPEATLTASGNWATVNAQGTGSGNAVKGAAPVRRSVLNLRLDIADAGELLKRLGLDGVIRKGKGSLQGQLVWLGSPMRLDYPSLGGQLNLNVENGQFLKAEPGLAKLLGVLSLQSLPRRLTLDFRDVFSEGFSFDFVRGDARIEQGIASTNNLQMKGVNAAVLMEGSADIARETQNLRVVVVPEINAATASLITAAINPVVGLGTFLAQLILRKPLSEAATREFVIDGTWADPRVTPVQRRASNSETAPEASAPALSSPTVSSASAPTPQPAPTPAQSIVSPRP